MMSARSMDIVISDALEAKELAQGDAELTLNADKAWANLLTAQRHALLYQRALDNAGQCRAASEQYAVQPGRQRAAEAMRLRAAEYERIAENHLKAGEACYDAGEILEAEVLTIEKRKFAELQKAEEAKEAQPAPPAQTAGDPRALRRQHREEQRHPEPAQPAHHPGGDDGEGE